MYRLANLVLLTSIALGLSACANNDKKISSWEVNDVYQSTTVTPNPTTGGKSASDCILCPAGTSNSDYGSSGC